MSNSADCVQVAVRVRPFIQSEISRGCVQIIEKTPNEPQLSITGDTNSKTQDIYTFNNVFMPEESQDKIYDDCVKPIIGKLFEGYNVTILAYGQTGSGKTYTMGTVFDGNWDVPTVGIIPRALKDIFHAIKTMESEYTVSVTCSFMELYQENLFDLLSSRPRDQAVCEIREDGTKGIIIHGLSEIPVSDADRAAKCLIQGGNNRSVGATAMNNFSSRSHAIFTVNVKSQRLVGDGKTLAKFHLVDLAGSERSKKTKATGTRFKEGVKINQGLLALGNVISALGGGQGSNCGFISYRDSKLTRLLQDSLGGNSVTLMVACVSPADYNIEETLSTLRYADRAKKIKNKPIKNEDSQAAEIGRLKKKIQELNVQLLESGGGENRKATGGNCDQECKPKLQERENEITDLRQKINKLMFAVNELNALHIVEDAFINDITESFQKFRDLVLKTCSAEFAMPDTQIFVKFQEAADEIDSMIKNFKKQIQVAPEDARLSVSMNDDIDNAKYKEFTSNQIEMFSKITELEREMKLKQELLDRKFQNAPIVGEDLEKTMLEYESTIKNLEKELDELRSSTSTTAARRDHNATKVNMDRKHKIDKLEKELTEVRKKCVTLEKTKKLAEQDRKRIEDLKREIQDMKTARVQLIRQQRTDSEMYKRFISNRDKEINCLKEKEKKALNEMKRMERLHEKQQAVLKRKVEEAKAINKRLQENVDKSKKISRQKLDKVTEKSGDIVQNYIDHEIAVMMSLVDAKHVMQSLMNDRGLLTERMQNLCSTVNKTEKIEEEIKQLEEDLEMRNAQITDIRSKLMETDLDTKLKNIPDNFGTIAELRLAMNYIIRALLENREDFINNKTKAEDLKAAYDTSEERIEMLVNEKSSLEAQFITEKNKMERDFEQKITLLYQKLNGMLDKDGEDKMMENMAEQLSNKLDENSQLKTRIEELERKLELKQRVEKKATDVVSRMKANGTFTIGDDEDGDLEFLDEEENEEEEEFDFNDSFNDPDWIKTPMVKRRKRSAQTSGAMLKESIVNRMDGTGLLNNISESSDTSQGTKRSIEGISKCSCKGSCATKLCGCKKVGNFCANTCKCSAACLNKPVHEGDIKENDELTPEKDKNHTKTDMKDITTPYYPYKNKKRRPLLPLE